MSIVLNNHAATDFIVRASGAKFDAEKDTSFVRLAADGRVIGGVLFTDYTFASINVHCAGFSPNWINQDLLWVTFDLPFTKLGVGKMIAPARESNVKSLALLGKLGFTIEARIADVYPNGEAMLISSLYRKDCRFLGLSPKGYRHG